MIENNWQKIWNKRSAKCDNFAMLNKEQMILELKRIDGFDISSSITAESFIEEYEETKKYLELHDNDIESVFEVGCGCGTNLYMFQNFNRGGVIYLGGIDYSDALINILKTVPTLENLRECICDEAKNIPTEIKYDAVFSTSVFHYFYDLNYSKIVLEKMLAKSNKSLGILHIHDKDKEKEFLEFRRKLNPNYDKLYKGLSKLFYDKEFFIQFAHDNNLKIEFAECNLKGFWDNPFIYNCFMYK